jgi:hypothetical protein
MSDDADVIAEWLREVELAIDRIAEPAEISGV